MGGTQASVHRLEEWHVSPTPVQFQSYLSDHMGAWASYGIIHSFC